ncbi:peptidoglycan-binding domain-containing protein, partial [Propylenella binzhouense]
MLATSCRTLSVLMCSSLILAAQPASEAQAGSGGAVAAGFAGFALGVIAGSAISRQHSGGTVRRSHSSGGSRPKASRQVARRSAETVAVQKALAFYGLYTGAIDGLAGPGTRAAVSALQTKMGWAVTGTLKPDEQAALLAQYASDQKGGPAPATGNNTGPKVDELFAMINGQNRPGAAGQQGGVVMVPGGPANGAPGAAAVVSPQPQPGLQPEPLQVAAAPGDGFRIHCPDISGSAAAAVPAGLTLTGTGSLVPEQFCRARTAAFVDSAGAFSGLGEAERGHVQSACAQMTDAMRPRLTQLATSAPAAFVQAIGAEFAGFTEAQKDQAAGNFNVCIGVGYAADRGDMVASAALGLVALGDTGYGEIVAAALALGAGMPGNGAKAIEWLDYTADEIEAGAEPVQSDTGVERASILRLMADQIGGPKMVTAAGRSDAPGLTPVAAKLEPAPVGGIVPAHAVPAGGGGTVVALAETGA